MKRRTRALLPFFAVSGAALCGSAALGQNNSFSLQVDPASADTTQLKAGDVLKLDVIFRSDNSTPIKGYQASLAFDPGIFDPKKTNDASIFTKNPSSSFALQAPNGVGNLNGERLFRGGENSAATALFPNTPTLLGTFNLSVLATAPAGKTTVQFSDIFSSSVPLNQSNLLLTTNNVVVKPQFQTGAITVTLGAAAVPEPSSLLGLSTLLGLGGLILRRKKNSR